MVGSGSSAIPELRSSGPLQGHYRATTGPLKGHRLFLGILRSRQRGGPSSTLPGLALAWHQEALARHLEASRRPHASPRGGLVPCKELLPPGATTPRRGGAFAAWAVHGYGVFRARRLETSRATATASAPLAPRPPLSIVSSDTPAPSLGVGACGDGSSHRHVHKGSTSACTCSQHTSEASRHSLVHV